MPWRKRPARPMDRRRWPNVTASVVQSLQPLATVLIVVGLLVALAAFVFDRRAADVAA